MTFALLIRISEGLCHPGPLEAPFLGLVGLSGHVTLQPPTLQLDFGEGERSLSWKQVVRR